MNYNWDDLLVDDESLDTYENEWIKESTEVLGSDTYSVYHGTGNSSLVKILINDEIIADL